MGLVGAAENVVTLVVIGDGLRKRPGENKFHNLPGMIGWAVSWCGNLWLCSQQKFAMHVLRQRMAPGSFIAQ
jgi:hypothetical protein